MPVMACEDYCSFVIGQGICKGFNRINIKWFPGSSRIRIFKSLNINPARQSLARSPPENRNWFLTCIPLNKNEPATSRMSWSFYPWLHSDKGIPKQFVFWKAGINMLCINANRTPMPPSDFTGNRFKRINQCTQESGFPARYHQQLLRAYHGQFQDLHPKQWFDQDSRC